MSVFPMPTGADLASFQMLANSRMTSRCTIHRATGNLTTNADGFEVPEYAAIYTGLACRIDSGSSTGTSTGVDVGGVTYAEATGVAHFPHPSPLLANDDIVAVTTGEWPGACYRIIAAVEYDQKTARRLPIVQEPKPEGVA